MNDDEIDTWQTDDPTCPWCGYVDSDSDDYYLKKTEGKEQCDNCGGWFSWESERTITFYTRKTDWVEEWNNYNRTKIQIAELRAIRGNNGS